MPGREAEKKSMSKCIKAEAGTGVESNKKLITCQLLDPTESWTLGEKKENADVLDSYNWQTDKLHPGLVNGRYTAEEDAALKQVIFGYIRVRYSICIKDCLNSALRVEGSLSVPFWLMKEHWYSSTLIFYCACRNGVGRKQMILIKIALQVK